jgi:hypothetical protein
MKFKIKRFYRALAEVAEQLKYLEMDFGVCIEYMHHRDYKEYLEVFKETKAFLFMALKDLDCAEISGHVKETVRTNFPMCECERPMEKIECELCEGNCYSPDGDECPNCEGRGYTGFLCQYCGREVKE